MSRLAAARIEFVHADIRCRDDLAFPSTRFDLIIDCSAEPAVLAAYESGPAGVIDTNLVGTVNLLEVARRNGADVVFLSTSRVYPVGKLEAIAFEETSTRFAIAAEQAMPGGGAGGDREEFPLDGAAVAVRRDQARVRADRRGIRGHVRAALRRRPLRRHHRAVADGQGRPGRLRILDGPPLFQAAAPIHRLRRDGKAGARLRRDRRAVRTGLAPDRRNRHARRAGSTTSAAGWRRAFRSLETTALCEEITGNRVEIDASAENRPADVRLYVTDNARVTADTGWSPRKTPRETLVGHLRMDSRERTSRRTALVLKRTAPEEPTVSMSVVVVTGSAGLIGSESGRVTSPSAATRSSASTMISGSGSSDRTPRREWNRRCARDAFPEAIHARGRRYP